MTPPAPPQVLTVYVIRSSSKDAPLVLQRLQAAAANSGEGLYQALATTGVPLRPSFSIGGGPNINGVTQPPLLSYKIGGEPEGLSAGELGGIVIGGVAGAVVIAAAIALLVLHRRHAAQARGAKTSTGGAATAAAAAAAAAAGKEGQGDASMGKEAAGKSDGKVLEVHSSSSSAAVEAAPSANVSCVKELGGLGGDAKHSERE